MAHQNNITEKIKFYVLNEIGFDDCRFTDPFLGEELDKYRNWLSKDYHGTMGYLVRHLPFKTNPNLLLENVCSAIVVIKNYKNTSEQKLSQKFKIARYAVGEDYHHVISKNLQKIIRHIESLDDTAKCYYGVDSRPLADRSLALKSGIGFLGKNTMVIKPGLGSYFFIGIILTNLNLDFDEPLQWDCGQCRLCLDACPTGAFVEPFQLDAKKCTSYQTIEQKEELSEKQIKDGQGWLFGCDICQEVCPYNRNSPLTNWKEFKSESGVGFDAFNSPSKIHISKNSALYRSRKRVGPNMQKAQDIGV